MFLSLNGKKAKKSSSIWHNCRSTLYDVGVDSASVSQWITQWHIPWFWFWRWLLCQDISKKMNISIRKMILTVMKFTRWLSSNWKERAWDGISYVMGLPPWRRGDTQFFRMHKSRRSWKKKKLKDEYSQRRALKI